MTDAGSARVASSEWSRDMASLAAPRAVAARAFRELRAAYRSPGRHYHTLGHALSVVRSIGRLSSRIADPLPVRLAGWFHDAVYDPRRGDNEAESAAFARRMLEGIGAGPDLVTEVGRLVLLTGDHSCLPGDRGGSVLLDSDLAILGAGRLRYAEYAAAVRREYAWVPVDVYARERRRILERLRGRTRLFRTPELRRKLEARARRNLREECAGLAAGRVPGGSPQGTGRRAVGSPPGKRAALSAPSRGTGPRR